MSEYEGLIERLRAELYRSELNKSRHKKLRSLLLDAIAKFEELDERERLKAARAATAGVQRESYNEDVAWLREYMKKSEG